MNVDLRNTVNGDLHHTSAAVWAATSDNGGLPLGILPVGAYQSRTYRKRS